MKTIMKMLLIVFALFGFHSILFSQSESSQALRLNFSADPTLPAEQIASEFGAAREAAERESRFLSTMAEWANMYSVLIRSATSNRFHPDLVKSSGTGVVIAANESIAFVVTNAHVVNRGPHDDQRVELGFTVPGEQDELVEARVVYRTDYLGDQLDFAIIAFNPKSLKRARFSLAPLPRPEEARDLIRTGRRIFAHGNPQSSRNSFNQGVISEARSTFGESLAFQYIKHDAAINPGNSGGPLVDIATGKIIGLNTIKRIDADNTGFAIPISAIMVAFNRVVQGLEMKGKGDLYLHVGTLPNKILESEGVLPMLVAAGYDPKKFPGVLIVRSCASSGSIRPGDYILEVDGKPIGAQVPLLNMLIETTPHALMNFKVVRNGKIVNLRTKIGRLNQIEYKRENEYILLSGLICQDLTPREREEMTRGRGGVLVTEIVSGSPAQALAVQGLIAPNSVIYQIQAGGHTYPIRNLKDLRRSLQTVQKKQSIHVFTRNPVELSEEQLAALNGTDRRPTAVLGNHPTIIVMSADPVEESAALAAKMNGGPQNPSQAQIAEIMSQCGAGLSKAGHKRPLKQ